MAACLNCRRKLSCGCQKREASDGKSCCASCVTIYEKSIKSIKNVKVSQPKVSPTITPGIVKVKITQTN